MRKFTVECDGCGKKLEVTQENIDRKMPTTYHMLQLTFRTFMIDPNTSQEEEVSNMARQTSSVYCSDCFLKLVDYMDKFIEEVSPDDSHFARSEYSPEVRRNQSTKKDSGSLVRSDIPEVVETNDLDALREMISLEVEE